MPFFFTAVLCAGRNGEKYYACFVELLKDFFAPESSNCFCNSIEKCADGQQNDYTHLLIMARIIRTAASNRIKTNLPSGEKLSFRMLTLLQVLFLFSACHFLQRRIFPSCGGIFFFFPFFFLYKTALRNPKPTALLCSFCAPINIPCFNRYGNSLQSTGCRSFTRKLTAIVKTSLLSNIFIFTTIRRFILIRPQW